MKINYAILNIRPGAEAVPVLLPASLSHDELALVGRPISAGCCTLFPDVQVFGRSVSLNLAAHADDARLIKMWFGRPETDDAPATSHDER
jgi:hypothetical protein